MSTLLSFGQYTCLMWKRLSETVQLSSWTRSARGVRRREARAFAGDLSSGSESEREERAADGFGCSGWRTEVGLQYLLGRQEKPEIVG